MDYYIAPHDKTTIWVKGQGRVATCHGLPKHSEKNALLILKALNCHDELLEACKLALSRLPQDTYGDHALKKIRHIIAKAESK